MQPFKVNDPQIFQDQFIKIIETTNNNTTTTTTGNNNLNKLNLSGNTSYIMNESQNNSLMQRDTAAGATTQDGAVDPSSSMIMQDTRIYS